MNDFHNQVRKRIENEDNIKEAGMWLGIRVPTSIRPYYHP